MFTPATQRVVNGVRAEFGSKVRTGFWLCRRISGTLTWSQHAYTESRIGGPDYQGNAVDIFPDNMAIGDQVYAFIRSEFAEETKTLLWRVKSHFDHLHEDTWPTGIATPPCKGGGLLVRHRDGRISNTFGAPNPNPPPPPPPPPPDPVPSGEPMLPITKESSQQDIGRLQDLINETYYAPFGQAGLTLDGIYGNGTAAAVRKWLVRYTNDTRQEVIDGRYVNFNQWNSLMRDWVLVITR